MPGKLSVTGLLLVAGGAGISLNSLISRYLTHTKKCKNTDGKINKQANK